MSNNIKISMLEKQDLELPRIFYLALGVAQSHLGTCCNGYSGSYGNSAILLHAGYRTPMSTSSYRSSRNLAA
ncbi:hypothetical protein LTR22_022092 [Elasticomyces elasticus]|uniref:Uncharacterized protein n=1 Tax=Elasticomyces elasticus TaxID=574655 RepID=A0AAN7VWT1_9PEZI|nr:hypothetical protein LTR22_022092 [Elasticomyces elasticus]KAK4908553.1 hypothetical protein LTR49_022576 [Elasticomyces elasticus]KAK5690180.1 hypothetical protein LTR97_012368 [Elasticomyces elasticus]KAK5747018.1 hypothetical protein LTS12_022534 [Elasticomyces elasticus]